VEQLSELLHLALFGGIILIGLWFLVTYNGLIGFRNQVKNAWAQIDVQLKRRHDPYRNIVETVKDMQNMRAGLLKPS